MQRSLFILMYLIVTVFSTAGDGENVRLAFSQQFIYRTPLLQDDDQSIVKDTVGEGRLFGIFINTTLYWQITESIDTYIADLESDDWQVVLYTVEGGTSNKSDPNSWTTEDFLCELEAAEQLRELLRTEYDKGMIGCILIGELPAGWVEAQAGSGTGCPVDLFFRNMDSQWNDTDGNGLLDENIVIDGDYKPEIWMSRLYANSLDGDEIEMMVNYFRKNHAYRIGELILPKRALEYVDDDFAYTGFCLRGIYDEITQVNDKQTTTATDYLSRLSEGYDLVRVFVHGFGWGHGFFENESRNDVSYWDIKNNDPCCFFYDIVSCGTFEWWNRNYIDGWYVFSHSYGLASWGWSDSGTAGFFYDALDIGKCLGDAQLELLDIVISINSYFGMFGDPTLTLRHFPESPTIVYVDYSAIGNRNGQNWENAYKNLQDALTAVSWGAEIHIAQGIYQPDFGGSFNLDDRTATFKLKNGVVIKGGYAGLGTADPNARDISSYETILSGNTGTPDANDNSYHIVTAINVGAAAVLDGFTIMGGYADGNSNSENNYGGGIYLKRSSPTIVDCNILSNYSMHGGGMCNEEGNMILKNCTFRNNHAKSAGGAIYNHGYIILERCKFLANNTDYDPYDGYGGAMMNYYSHSALINCLFSENRGSFGGAINNQWSISVLNNCTFCQNVAYSGGSFWNYVSSSILTNCILWNNEPQEIAHYDTDSITDVLYSDIEGGWSTGTDNINIDPEFADPNNGDYHLKSQEGRWNSIDEIWAIDKIDSPCIDKGDPNTPVGDEPEPNGGRINMGAYGGTQEASKSFPAIIGSRY